MLAILNLLIRSINLTSKFILVIFLAKLLDTKDFGNYGLLSSIINLSLYFIGLEFYIYSNREALKDRENYSTIISSHTYLIGVTYLSITLPLFFLLKFNNSLDQRYILLFFILLFLEHINQEIMRFLTILGRPILANLLFLIRSSSWSILIVIKSFFYKNITLIQVLNLWIIAEVVCLTISLFYLIYKEKVKINIRNHDFTWIKKGLSVCLPFMIGTLAIRFIFTGDRYFIEFYFTDDILSAYVLFSTIAASISSFIDASVFSFLYPKLVKYILNKDIRYKFITRQLYKRTFIFLLLLNIFFILLITPLLSIINKKEFYQYVSYFYPLLLAQSIYCLSMIPHYILFSLKKDKYIIISHIYSAVIFFFLIIILTNQNKNINIIFLSLNISFLFLFLYKLLTARKFIKDYEHTNFNQSCKEL